MPKVVINTCYGGFYVSQKAIEYMIACGLEPEYVEVNLNHDPDKPNSIVNRKYYLDLDIPRNHPLLIEAVETLGEEAIELGSELQVVEFKGNKYRIVEDDGKEWVETPDSIQWDEID